jgi:hypothetical protein
VDIGHVVLYVLFALVALWLLTEALWQHGAPFRYRVLALFGFLAVVAGVAMGNLIAIGAGVFCFAVGQFLTTRHIRRGYHHGWTLGRRRAVGRSRHGRARVRS